MSPKIAFEIAILFAIQFAFQFAIQFAISLPFSLLFQFAIQLWNRNRFPQQKVLGEPVPPQPSRWFPKCDLVGEDYLGRS